jgi:hypothetical protein
MQKKKLVFEAIRDFTQKTHLIFVITTTFINILHNFISYYLIKDSAGVKKMKKQLFKNLFIALTPMIVTLVIGFGLTAASACDGYYPQVFNHKTVSYDGLCTR